MMWIFPQGTQTSRYEPIVIRPGVEYLAKHNNDAVILPVSFAYEFFREQKPQALIRFGRPVPAVEIGSEWVRQQLQALSDQVQEDCRQGKWKITRPCSSPSLRSISVGNGGGWSCRARARVMKPGIDFQSGREAW
ncbi:MAG: hypothetical protein HC904_15925 [Blastochloris sp.]|nr:hypothetical protein [Blastochloris sp.]